MLNGMKCGITPTSPAAPGDGSRRRQLEGAFQAGHDGDDAGPGHAVVDGPEVIERVAKGQNMGAVDVGHGTDGGDIEVSPHELDAHGVPLPDESPGRRRNGLGPVPGPGPDGSKPEGGEIRPGPFECRGREAAEDQGKFEGGEGRAHGPLPGPRREAFPEPGRELLLADIVAYGRSLGGTGLGSRLGLPDGQHLFDRRYPGDGLFGEAEAVGHRADELAVDIDRTAAHPGDDSGRLEAEAVQTGQDDVALWLGVLEDAEDLGIELLDRLALEDALAPALHPGFDLGEGKDEGRRLGGQAEGEEPQGEY
jgi:hypothetical protein